MSELYRVKAGAPYAITTPGSIVRKEEEDAEGCTYYLEEGGELSGSYYLDPKWLEPIDNTPEETPPSPLDKQVGGGHYKDMAIQPIEFIVKNNIPYREANVIKYTCRHASKNKAEDIKKAIHYLEMILEDYNG